MARKSHDDDTIVGGPGKDTLNGGRGNDTIEGGAGDDRVFGKSGDDVLDGGPGRDYVSGGRGDDRLIFSLEEPGHHGHGHHGHHGHHGYGHGRGRNDYDRYDGGRGFDTLVINLTADQYADTDLQAELVALLDAIDAGTLSGGYTYLAELRLAIRSIEAVEIYVDGVPVDPRDTGGETPVAVDDSFTVDEDGTLADDVSANDTVPAGSTFTLVSGVDEGTLLLNGDGTFSYEPGSFYDSLAEGASALESFTYQLTSGGTSVTATATITITGTNDTPTVAAAIAASAAEDDAVFSVDLLAGAADVDDGAVLSVANVSALPAGVVLNGNSVDVDPADASFQHLNVGDSDVITVTYEVTDEHGASVPQTATITITGTNDTPTVAAAIAASAAEDDAVFSVDLLAGAADVDDGAVLSVANVSALPAGVVLNGNSVDVDPADASFQHLNVGDSDVITVTYEVTDEHGASVPQTATITITGTNDTPTVAAAIAASAAEDDAVFSVDLLAGAADVDDGAVLSVANVSALPAGVVLNGNSVDVDPSDASFQHLNVGDSDVITVTYEVTDEHGASVPQTATITITGTNDTPLVTGAVEVTTNEDETSIDANLLATASDVDDGAVLTPVNVAQASGPAVPWSVAGDVLTIDPSAFQYLAVGESVQVSFTFDVEDEHGASAPASAVFTIEGRNDDPYVTAEVDFQLATIGTAFSASIAANFDDVDTSDTLTYTAQQANGDLLPGWLTLDPATGEFSGTPTSGSGMFRIEVTATDPHGATATESFWLILGNSIVMGTPDCDDLAGDNSANIFLGLEENDRQIGGDQADFYIHRDGDGLDVIEDDGFGDTDILYLSGLVPADIELARGGPVGNDLLVKQDGEIIAILVNTLGGSSQDQIEEIVFEDGTVWTIAEVRDILLQQQLTGGDDIVHGFHTPETIDAGTGADQVFGGDGSDVYVYKTGYGVLSIEDDGFADGDALQVTGYLSTDAGFAMQPGDRNTLVVDFGSGDVVTIHNTLESSSQDAIENVFFFDDGVNFIMSDLRVLLVDQQASSGDDTITGFNVQSDVLAGGTGRDVLRGLDSSDTYIYNAGDGHDVIEDDGFADTDVVQIGGYASTDAMFSAMLGARDTLVIDFGGGDSITVVDTLNGSSQDQIEQFVFAGDGVTLTSADIRDLVVAAQASSGDDDISGYNTSADTLAGGLGDDFLSGQDGSDTYVFNPGDGQDVIEDNGFADTDVLQINGYSSTDATFSQLEGARDTLVIGLPGGDQVVLVSTLDASSQDQIEQIVFGGDGAVVTMDALRVQLIGQQQTAGDDVVIGFSRANDVLEAGLGDDYMSGGDFSDTYVFNPGDGRDIVNDNGFGDTDVLDLSGYLSTDATFRFVEGSSSDYVIELPGGDEITVLGQTTSQGRIEEFVFSDTTLTYLDVATLVAASTPPGDVFTGTSGSDTLSGNGGYDHLFGLNGADTYEFDPGDGRVEIEDNGNGGGDVLVINGVLFADASFSTIAGDPDDLLIGLPGGEEIRIRNTLGNSFGDTIETIQFTTGGVTLSIGDVIDLLVNQQIGTGDDVVTGFNGANTIEAGLGDDYVSGGEGSDTYIFNAGDGVDVIDDNGGADTDVLSIVGYSSTDATFAYATGDRSTLVITLPGGDQITIRNGLTNSFADNIEQIAFSGDGVTLTPSDITDILNAQQITAGDDVVIGTSFNETIEAGTGDDYVSGQEGSDLYVFNVGDGHDVIDDNGGADNDQVQFTGYSSTDATFSLDNADGTTLVIDFGGGDSVTIRNTLENSFADAIEGLVFDGDGVTLTMADVRAMLVEEQQSAGDDSVQGFNQTDAIDGGPGDDYLTGRDGSDTYSYTLGDGSDVIDDNGGADTDQLVIDGVLSTDVSFAREPGYPNSLVITMPDGATVTIRDQLNSSFADTIEQVTFTADAVTLTPADLRALVLAAESTGGDDTIVGFSSAETITGGLGDDYLIGGDGSDTFVFNVGDGDDIVHDQGAADTDALLFAGRNIADATFQALVPGSDDLLITFANGDSVIVIDGLAGSFANNIEQFQFDDGMLTSADVLLLV